MLKKSLISVMFAISFSPLWAMASDTHYYKAIFYNISSYNKGLSLAGCQELLREISFRSENGKTYFDQHNNPQYDDHQILATLPVQQNALLQIIQLHTKFVYENKQYDFITQGSSIVYQQPFQIDGVIINPYCKAAYKVVNDNSLIN